MLSTRTRAAPALSISARPLDRPPQAMEVPGTFRGVVVMAPRDRCDFGDNVERCMWCASLFDSTGDDDKRRMAAMYTTESGDDLWDGDYIHGCCGYLRHRATEGARGAAGGGGGGGGVRPSGRWMRGR